jgi:hypothetical protein
MHRADSRTLAHNVNQDRTAHAGGYDVLATVSSFTLSNTSNASDSFPKEIVKVSKVRQLNVRGHWPCNVCGTRVTSEIKGYGTWKSS